MPRRRYHNAYNTFGAQCARNSQKLNGDASLWCNTLCSPRSLLPPTQGCRLRCPLRSCPCWTLLLENGAPAAHFPPLPPLERTSLPFLCCCSCRCCLLLLAFRNLIPCLQVCILLLLPGCLPLIPEIAAKMGSVLIAPLASTGARTDFRDGWGDHGGSGWKCTLWHMRLPMSHVLALLSSSVPGLFTESQ